MWLQKAGQIVLVPERMPDTIKRCLADGWVEVPDPRPVMPESETDADAQPPLAGVYLVEAVAAVDESKPIPLRREKGRR